jgi:hypothetical protein
MEYFSHTYPRELARKIISYWPVVDNPLDKLPPDEAVVTLLSEAFQASLLREESRPVTCRLALVTPSELSDAAGPPMGVNALQLADERKLHAQEIRRLSPSATFYRSLIGVRWNSQKGFLIWGILNSGIRWVARTDGGRLYNSAAPDRLIINIRGPGNLVLLRGDTRIVTLLNGRLEGHGFDIYQSSWLAKLQEMFGRWAIQECFKDHKTGAMVDLDFPRMLGQNFVRRLISQVRHARHGGMLIILKPEERNLVQPLGPIRPKYWIKDTPASQRYCQLLFTVMQTLSQVGAEQGLRTVGWREYQELKDERLAEVDEAIFEHAHFMADLMATDGALVLTAARDVIGFGAEIQVPTTKNEVVHRALDIEGVETVEERADEAGTRHRAAYRLSREHTECIIIVVSQDGSVRYVGNRNGKVTYWDVLSF